MVSGFDTSAYFYIPASDEPPNLLSGIVVALFGEYADPTASFSYFSRKEDVDKVIHTTIKHICCI